MLFDKQGHLVPSYKGEVSFSLHFLILGMGGCEYSSENLVISDGNSYGHMFENGIFNFYFLTVNL